MIKMTNKEIENHLKSRLGYCTVEETTEGPYFRQDTDDSDLRQQWDNYIDVSEALKEIGYILDDPLVEHDCTTGIIREDNDNLEGLIAGQVGPLMGIHLSELKIKESLIKHFDIELEFEYEYKDFKLIVPKDILKTHPVFSALSRFDWVIISEYAEQLMALNRKATEFEYKGELKW